MDRFLNYDNKFIQALSKLMDCIIISVLWLLMCIPVVTAGASTTALYKAVHEVIRRDRGYIWNEYWSAFRENFKKATKMWLIFLLIMVILVFDLVFSFQALKESSSLGYGFPFFLILYLFVSVWGIYVFSYTARFEQTIKATLKNGVLIMIAKLPWSLLIMVIYVATLVGVYVMPLAILIMPGVATVFMELILEKVFRSFMSPEDLAKELEADQEDAGKY